MTISDVINPSFAQLESLHAQHGIEFVVVGVRSSSTSYTQPHIVTSPAGENFWRVTMPQGIHEWAGRMEAYSIGGLHGQSIGYIRFKCLMLIPSCRACWS